MLVLVEYDFHYTAKDGRLVSIKPNESYILVCKTNEHWWRVRRDQRSRPFYVPAQYVKEMPSRSASPERGDKMTAVATQPSSQGALGEDFVFWGDVPETEKPEQIVDKEYRSGSLLNSQHPDISELYMKPVPRYRKQSEDSLQDHNSKHDDDEDFPEPPNLPPLDPAPEENLPDCGEQFEPTEPEFKGEPGRQAADGTFSAEASTGQVEDETSPSAVYVNVEQLRQSVSESTSSCSPSYLDLTGWEVHVDQESGQEYYYHPSTGQTTWDKPCLESPTYSEHLTAGNPLPPSPPLSPAFSPSPASPTPVWSSDWEQLVDETSGRPYFYNPMSGETTWEPPEQLSPYPPLMEPMSVHRFHEDGPPPLPEEDYPQDEDQDAEEPEELLATGPPMLPKEYMLRHVGRPIIPRASLDRSTPAGWSLSVDPTGAWVFTSEHSPEQWIKSVDDRGHTYYYLRDGSRSLWNLPEAPVAPGQSRAENGVEGENTSVIKNWRHTVGPAQLGSPQDDGNQNQNQKARGGSHHENCNFEVLPDAPEENSDYSSDSSSTGNSPETQHHAFGYRCWRKPYYLTSRWLRYNVQNLEKAGILNKTKVSENGKKVRKNWTQTWTVLHGGVLTFHKDPKSTTTGASNKTNQIVPEVTVDLKGATICWATKDKSSKKNVLELKTKNALEFLIQYDTESIIVDWHRVLTDTIRQLEYQDHPSDEEDGDLYEKIGCTDAARDDRFGSGPDKRRSNRPSVTHSSSSAGDTDPKRVRTKLMKFLMKRPTLQSVKEKGYIRDNVFGCHLATLCAQEKTTVPRFVEKCIKAVEKRGLDIDGLYRVSGNLAVIQKLRYKADHEELDLEDGQWGDVHVITGALKLFFRELPEPLFPFSHFNKFVAAIRIPDYNKKLSCIYELVNSLPSANHDTMKLLFGHLRRVIQYGDDNRMTVQNVAIVFGPTLLRPEMESQNIALHMVFQNQIVEFILNEYDRLFYSS